MKKLLVAFSAAVTVLSISAIAQPPDTLWTQTYGGIYEDGCYCVQQTSDGGFIVAGYKTVMGYSDLWLIKTDTAGNVEREYTYGGPLNDYGYGVQQTADGGYIAVGSYRHSGSDYDAWLIKVDSNGSLEWDRTYGGSGGDDGHSVQQTSDGGYIIAGGTYSYGVIWDVWLIKTYANGTEEWNRVFGGGGYQAASCVQQTSDGGYIVSGYTTPYHPFPWDAWLIKTDRYGNREWDYTYGGGGGEYGASVRQTVDGGFICAGFTDSYGAGLQDFGLIKTSQNGAVEWNRTFGGSGVEEAYCVQQTTDGGYIMAGTTSSYGASNKDIWLVKTDANGDSIWTQTFGGSGQDAGSCVQQTTDGGYIIAGTTSSYGAGNEDIWLIRLAEEVQYVSEPIHNHSSDFSLQIPYPNPFNPSTVLSFQLQAASGIKLAVYDIAGGETAVLVEGFYSAGRHRVVWDASSAPSGVYLARLQAGEFFLSQKLILMK